MPFSGFGLHSRLLRGVKEMGFTRPTPIQHDAIPPAIEGRDVLACAMTGSGKNFDSAHHAGIAPCCTCQALPAPTFLNIP